MQSKLNRLKLDSAKLLQLHDIGLELASLDTYNEVLVKIVESAALLTESEEAAIFLFDTRNKKLMLRAVKEAGKKNGVSSYDEVKFEHGKSNNTAEIKIGANEIEKISGKVPSSYICTPISIEEDLGTLCIYSHRASKRFSEQDEELLFLFAQNAAVAIKKSVLLGLSYVKAETYFDVYEVSKLMLSEVDLNKLFDVILDNALRVLDADIVVLYEYSKDRGDVKVPPVYKGSDVKMPEAFTVRGKYHREALLFKVLENKEPFYAEHARKDWGTAYLFNREPEIIKTDFISREAILSSAGVPLIIDDDPVGVLFVNYRSLRKFTQQLRIRIETFANEAALAIRNAKIFTERDRYINELSVLNTITQRISSGITLSTNAILHLIYEQTGRLMDVTNFFVAFYDQKQDVVSFEFAVENGVMQEVGRGQWESRKSGKGLTEYIIRERKTIRISSQIYKKLIDLKVDAIGSPPKSWMGVPLIHQDGVLGIIVVQNSEKENAYDKRDEKILETIASQAAIAIAQARLFQKSKNQVEEINTLYNISQQIISKATDILSVLKTILDGAVKISGADAGEILFYNDTTGESTALITFNADLLKGVTLQQGEGMAAKVIKQREAQFTNDYFNSPYFAETLDKPMYRKFIKGMVQVPLKVDDIVWGILALITNPESGHEFTHKDINRLDHYSSSASLAITISRQLSFRQHMVYNNPDAIIAVDRIGKITQFNKSSERITGFKSKDVIGKIVTGYYYDGVREARRINHILIQSEESSLPVQRIRTAIKGKNGEKIPILFSGVVLRNELGERIGSLGLISDLREIEQLDEEFRKQQEFLMQLEHYPQDTSIVNYDDLQERMTNLLQMTKEFFHLDYTILFASTSEDDTVLKAIAWTGIPNKIQKGLPHFNWRRAGMMDESVSKEVVLKNETELISKWQPDNKWAKKIIQGIRGGNSDFFTNLSCGIPVRLADNYRALLIFGPFKEKTDLFEIYGFIRNVAQTISINALSWLQAIYLRASEREAERAKRLIIHRIRMQLQQVIGKFGVIKSAASRKEELRSIDRNAQEGEKMIRHFSKILTHTMTSHIAEMEPADYNFLSHPLPALILNCVEGFMAGAKKSKRIISVDPGVDFLPYADIDPLMLTIALGNLIDNALKYSYLNTKIEIFAERNYKEAKIFVRNYGEEMPEDARANLYQPGMRWGMTQRAKSLPGTGFGLWDSSAILNAHGGKLEFSSEYLKYKGEPAHLVQVWMVIPLKRGKSK